MHFTRKNIQLELMKKIVSFVNKIYIALDKDAKTSFNFVKI